MLPLNCWTGSAGREARSYQTILTETERLNVFASRLLQLAAVEQRRDIERELFALAVPVKDVIEAHAVECESRGLTVILNQTADQEIHGDRFLIRQAIDNLFRNAIVFRPWEEKSQ